MRRELPALRWLRSLFTRVPPHEPQHPGVEAVRVIPAALVALEARACDRLVEPASASVAPAAGPWVNALGRSARVVVAPGPAAAVARGTGLALAGLRTAVFVDVADLPGVAVHLAEAARRLAPLVVYAIGGERGSVAPGAAIASIVDTGAAIAVPATAAQALDLALVARVLAERSMGPVVVVVHWPMCGVCSAPDDADIRAVLGSPADAVDPESAAQRVLLGTERPRLWPWFDADHPVAAGLPGADPSVAAAARGMLGVCRPEALHAAAARVAQATGRTVEPVVVHGGAGAKAVVVACGPAVSAVAEAAEASKARGIGVVAVAWLRPLAVDALGAAVDGRRVAVLDLADPSPGGPAPLFRELASAVGGREWVSALVGDPRIGLAPHRLASLLHALGRGELPRVVHLDGAPAGPTGWPRRDALLDALGDVAPPAIPGPTQAPAGPGAVALVATGAVPGDVLGTLAAHFGDGAELGLGSDLRLAVAGHAGSGIRLLVVSADLARIPVDLLDAMVADGVVVHHGALPARVASAMSSRHLRAIRHDGPDLLDAALAIASAPAVPAAQADLGALPDVVRQIPGSRDAPDSLPRFWATVLEPALTDGADRRLEPVAGSGAIPAATAALAPPVDAAYLPVLDPAACTACGACWSACPDAAIGVAVLGLADLLTGASRAAGTEGRDADAVRRAHDPLARRVARVAHEAGARTLDGDALREGWTWLAPKLAAAGQDGAGMDEAFRKTATVVDRLAPVASADLFHAREADARGTGEVLVLAVDASTCQGCGLCVAVCPEDALAAVDRTPELLDDAQGRWRALQRLPDTSGATIERLDGVVGPMAAALSSRHVARAQLGGVANDPGSGERLGLRLVTAAVERGVQPGYADLARRLDAARTDLEARLRDALAGAVAGVEVDRVARALAEAESPRASLRDIAAHIDADGVAIGVDRHATSRLARAVVDLRGRHHRVVSGADGLGRARLGVVLAGSGIARRLAPWPWNPWWAPAVVADPTTAADLALGIAEGVRARHLDDVRALRGAALLATSPADLDDRLARLDALAWADLDAAERSACPAMLLVGDATLVGNLSRVLGSDRPLTVVVLDGLSDLGARFDPALLAVMQPDCHTAATSVAYPDHLARSVRDALVHPGPALVHVHAPSPARHGFPTDATLDVARAAVARRAHVLLRCDPRADAALALRLDLSENPETDAPDCDPTDLARWRLLRELAGIDSPVVDRLRGELAASLAADHTRALDAERTAHDAALQATRAGGDAASIARLTERFLDLAGYRRGEA